MTLAAACWRYHAEVAARQSSAVDTEKALEHIARLIGGDKLLVEVNPDTVADAVRRRSAEEVVRRKDGKSTGKLVANATVNRQIVEPLRRVLRRAKRVWKVPLDLDQFPWGDLKLEEPAERVLEFSADEERRFCEAMRPDYHPIVWFFVTKGLRKAACVGLTQHRVDLENLAITVQRKTKKQGLHWSRQRITQSQAAVLQREMALAPGEAVWSYIVQRGPDRGERRPITEPGLNRAMDTAFRAAGIDDFRIHDLRHDFASKLLRRTQNLKLVMRALDHSHISATVRYAHVLDEDVAQGLSDLEQSRSYPGVSADTDLKKRRNK
jgi:integrase